MADAKENFVKMEALCREAFAAGPDPAPPPGFTGRVMAHVLEKAEGKDTRRYFLRVARSIVLAGSCLAAVLALVMIRGYVELNLASLAEAMTQTTGLHLLAL